MTELPPIPVDPPLWSDWIVPWSRHAADMLRGVAHRTPVVTCHALDRYSKQALYLKCENLQKGGAFKFRGAYFATGALPAADVQRGVVTHSSGNHAQALALAAHMRGVAAHIVMPENAPDVKRRAVAGYGARIVSCESTIVARERTADAVVAETGGVLVPPYDHPLIIAGQGTVALELLEQVAELDVVIVPVGGGGLLSGVSLVLRALAPHVRIVAAEPLGADDAFRSREARELCAQDNPQTVADGLRTSLGRWTWPVVRDVVDAVLTVSDAQIVEAMRWIWERAKLIVEPSGAIGVAVAASAEFARGFGTGQRVGVVLSGGNVDLDALPWQRRPQ